MNGFKCNVTASTSSVALAGPQVPRRCGADPDFQKFAVVPGNCTFGAKQPFYWFQQERNNVRFLIKSALYLSSYCDALTLFQMFEGDFAPPFYTDLYNFLDGAQNDIFEDSYIGPIPTPGPNQTLLPQLAQILQGTPSPASNGSPTSGSLPITTALIPSASLRPSPNPVAVLKQWYVRNLKNTRIFSP